MEEQRSFMIGDTVEIISNPPWSRGFIGKVGVIESILMDYNLGGLSFRVVFDGCKEKPSCLPKNMKLIEPVKS